MTTRVVLVRPWTDAHGGAGCCGGVVRGGICFDERVGGQHEHDPEVSLVGETFLLLRDRLPDVDVQIVGANNTAYLLPTTFRAARRERGAGVLRAIREASRATTAGAVLVDGERVGDVTLLGASGVLAAVRQVAAVTA